MLISEMEGLKFPDVYATRFFFKESLDKKKGKVLELGCGNGNNLMMFYQYGWDVAGVDKDENYIKQAKNNFGKCQSYYALTNTSHFPIGDMVDFTTNYKGQPFDVLLLSNVINYLDYIRIIECFSWIRGNRIVKEDSLVFVRTKSIRDYMFGKGSKLGEKTFKVNTDETGEGGCINTFLTDAELADILKTNLALEFKDILHCDFDNYQNGKLIPNSHIVLWGKVKKIKKQ